LSVKAKSPPGNSSGLIDIEVSTMSKCEVFEALTGKYLGEVDSLLELNLGDGISAGDGRVFRISSMVQTGPAGKRVRRIEVIETDNSSWIARLDQPAG
jgi:hypothetical protein